MKKIYLAGPLFSQYEIKERLDQAHYLREQGFEVFNPYEINGQGKTKLEIFETDIEAMKWCDFAIINVDNYDSGTMAELGWFYANEKLALGIWSNWKLPVNNLFVEGMLTTQGNKLFTNIVDLVDYVKTL